MLARVGAVPIQQDMPAKQIGFRDTVVEPTSTRRIGPIDITVSTVDTALDVMLAAVAVGETRMFAFCNAHTVNLARRSGTLVAALARATTFNDGVGIDLASRLLYGSAFPANLNGTDLTPLLLERLAAEQRSIFLVGSAPGIAAAAATVIERRYPGLKVAGTCHGFFDPATSESVIEGIRSKAPALILVGMGQPRQEVWAAGSLEKLDTVVLCVGAFLDFCSGTIPRAPVFFRRARIEWLYRLWLEPRRLAGRYLFGNARFLIEIAIDKLTPRSS